MANRNHLLHAPLRLLSHLRTKSSAGPGDDLSDDSLTRFLTRETAEIENHIREGRFQRSLSLIAGLASILTGFEVTYEHYRGSYSQKVMWTPVILSGAMTVGGIWGFFSPKAARSLLRWISAITLADGIAGFGFHIRGIARKPGGWRLPLTNIIMGPPIFSPLLFGISAYLGLIASFLRPEEAPVLDFSPKDGKWSGNIREGRFQKHLAAATILSTFLSGSEAWYSHYKNNFKYKVQWSPVIITPLLMAAAAASIKSEKAARTALPATSLLAIADGIIGFYYHGHGILRRPGGRKQLLYNIMYGPPIFAPLLFSACGTIGLLASLMRRENR